MMKMKMKIKIETQRMMSSNQPIFQVVNLFQNTINLGLRKYIHPKLVEKNGL
jgi:hypothetical protein